MSNIVSLATASPSRYIQGQEAYEYFNNAWNLSPRQDKLYKKILLNGPIKGRHIAVQHDKLTELPSQDQLIDFFSKQARSLTLQAAKKAIDQAHLKPDDIKAMVVNTCTGYLCPGLTSYLAQDLNLPFDTKVFDLMGMGCGAAIPNFDCACSIAQRSNDPVLAVAVEICSATIFDSPDPGCIISNCIFGDGAAAAVISPQRSSQKPLAKIVNFQSGVFPEYRDCLKYTSDQGKLRNVLSSKVPLIGAKVISRVTNNLLKNNHLSFADINHWAVHPGGTAVLSQVQKQLNLTSNQLRHSYKIFENYGNMSSPSVLFVLKDILQDTTCRKGNLCCLLSFGAGFTAHAALLQIC